MEKGVMKLAKDWQHHEVTTLESFITERNPRSWSDWEHECAGGGIVRRRLKNDTLVYVEQCRLCGRQIRCHKKDTIAAQVCGAWDESISQSWEEARRRLCQNAKDQQDAEWWAKYNSHITSAKWNDIRRRVIKRAGGVCEGCGEEPAWHVHHTTYRNLGNEFLFELLALCGPCHSRVHGRDVEP